MLNYLRAELYRLLHSKSFIGFILGCLLILFLSMIFGEMTLMGSGEGMLLDIGFQAKSYLSIAEPTFETVAQSCLGYTAFFWLVNVLFTATFFNKEYELGTIKLSVAYGIDRRIIYFSKAIIILVVSILMYFTFIFGFFVLETIQSGYLMCLSEILQLLQWTVINGLVLLAMNCLVIFLCVLISNISVVTGVSCIYIFSGASVYLMSWASMETLFPLLRYYVYANPMFYWMNVCSSNITRIMGYLPWYLIGSTLLLIIGCILVNRKEIQ